MTTLLSMKQLTFTKSPSHRRYFLAVSLVAVLACLPSSLCRAQEPLDGPKRIFKDDLLDNLVGKWQLTRKMKGREQQDTVDVEWILNHQFLRMHMKGQSTADNYEA